MWCQLSKTACAMTYQDEPFPNVGDIHNTVKGDAMGMMGARLTRGVENGCNKAFRPKK